MNESQSSGSARRGRPGRAGRRDEAEGQLFILPFISEPPARHTRRAGRRGALARLGPGGGEREGAGRGGFSGTRASGAAGAARRARRVRDPARVTVTTHELSPRRAESWRRRALGLRTGQSPRGPRAPRGGRPPPPYGSAGPGSAPAVCPFPIPPAGRGLRGPCGCCCPAPTPRVPTDWVLRARGRGPGWAAWPAPESAALARSPRPGPARGPAAACRHPGQGPDPARAPCRPAPPGRSTPTLAWLGPGSSESRLLAL